MTAQDMEVLDASATFADRLVAWQRRQGRHGLPWQATRDPYRVWLSEIMLQQTQVQTVLGYYDRFLAAFPTVAALAQAPAERVMALWSGLGYYSRARNLHQAAQRIMRDWEGRFPPTAQALATLPGIGPSTANAIAAFCYGERVTILDANVQRVVARHQAFAADLASTTAVKALWQVAHALLPAPADAPRDMPAYTQGLMDLGALVCTARKPRCEQCPVAADCAARRGGEPERYPVKTRKLKRSAERWWWLVVMDARQRVLVHTRPASGIWAQLQVFPTFSSEAELGEAVARLGLDAAAIRWHPSFKHVLTHKDLTLAPALIEWPSSAAWPRTGVGEPALAWMQDAHWLSLQAIADGAHAVPAPLRAWVADGLDDLYTFNSINQ